MLKLPLIRVFLTMTLQFAVAGVAYSYVDDKRALSDALEPSQGPYVLSHAYKLSQNDGANLRSRSDVIQEVKRQYNAEVLKISLNERKQVYRVRVLMPNGKVRNLRINARR